MKSERDRDLEYITMPHFLHHACAHFFCAMQEGYANTPKKGTVVELPGSKTIEYRHEKWRILDTYLVTPQSPYSGGTTIEWYGNIPVWMMQYMGYYEPEAIPCLKAALRANYEKEVFDGGRGPRFFRHEGYTYINEIGENNFFGRTTGEEKVFGLDGTLVGWHRYQSMYMVKE